MTVGIAVLVGIAGALLRAGRFGRAARWYDGGGQFTADGKLKQPVGYRKWVYVGEVVTPNDLDGRRGHAEFHSVYMDPESFAEYEKTGERPGRHRPD